MTREPDLFKGLYQKHILGQSDKYWITFSVTIGISKEPSLVEFHLYAPILAY